MTRSSGPAKISATNTTTGEAASTVENYTVTVKEPLPTPSTPTISGTAREGNILTASSKTGGSDEPLTITYQWQNSTDGKTWTRPSGWRRRSLTMPDNP